MSAERTGPSADELFAAGRKRFSELIGFLEGESAAGASAAELEEQLEVEGRELMRQLLQSHLDLRAIRERRIGELVSTEGVAYNSVEADHSRPFVTLHGEVSVTRLAYRHRGEANLHPADSQLNLPKKLHSHGLSRLAAIESARGSFEEARQAIERASGVTLGKRQVERLAYAAAVDFEDFYASRRKLESPASEQDEQVERDELVLCLSADGKGIVMRPEALRPGTARKAAESEHRLKTRLSKGEKNGRKRMSEVVSCFDVKPEARSVDDVLAHGRDSPAPKQAPKAANKWTMASVVEDTKTVIGKLFDEAERRDPEHRRTWVVLVDGACHQIDVITAEGRRRGITLHILCDLIHVLEYLWGAAWCFNEEGAPSAEAWVAEKAREVLLGNASRVAAAIRCKATALQLTPSARKNADAAADYLLAKAPYLAYPEALAGGWPIASGVIEGACRYLVADRMAITGARWGLQGAEAVLRLRALRANRDFDEYWLFHLAQERRRVHESLYAGGVIPRAA